MRALSQEDIERQMFIEEALRRDDLKPTVNQSLKREQLQLAKRAAMFERIKKETDWRTPLGVWRSMPHQRMVADVQCNPRAWRKFVVQLANNRQGWKWNPVDAIAGFIEREVPSGSVSDFGCGDAGLAKRLAKSRPDITVRSFDINAYDDTVEVCDVAETPLEDASQKVVVFSCAMWGDTEKTLAEAKRVLVPGGQLVVAEPASHYEPGELGRNVRAAGFAVTKEKEDYEGRFIHILAVKVGRL